MEKIIHMNMAKEARLQRLELEKQIDDLRIVENFHLRKAGVTAVVEDHENKEADEPVDEPAASVNLGGLSIASRDFANLRYVHAIELVLRTAGKPLLAKEISDILIEGGKGGEGQNNQSIYNAMMTTLHRHKDKFTRKQGRWMLVEQTADSVTDP